MSFVESNVLDCNSLYFVRVIGACNDRSSSDVNGLKSKGVTSKSVQKWVKNYSGCVDCRWGNFRQRGSFEYVTGHPVIYIGRCHRIRNQQYRQPSMTFYLLLFNRNEGYCFCLKFSHFNCLKSATLDPIL